MLNGHLRMNFLRGNTRRSLLGFLSGAGPAAASFLGFRIGRVVILRISALLAIRTILSSVELPIDSGVISYLWTFLFATVQASFFAGMAASFLNLGGILSLIGRYVFSLSGDAAFVSLYGNLVMFVGPLCSSLVEAVVMTYEVMRISREVAGKVQAAEARGGGEMLKRVTVGAAVLCAALSAFIVFLVQQVYPGIVPKIMGSIVALLFAVCFISEDGLFLESGLLALLSCVTLSIGLIEEFDCPTFLLDAILVGKNGGKPNPIVKVFNSECELNSDQVRALLLIYTIFMLMVAMARAPRFLYLTQMGSEALDAEEASVAARVRVASNGGGVATEGHGSEHHQMYRQPHPVYELRGMAKGLYNALVLVAVTFRILIWSREVHVAEYLPGLCRFVQVVAMLLLHRIYAIYGRSEEPEVVAPEPRRDMAGNIIQNPVW